MFYHDIRLLIDAELGIKIKAILREDGKRIIAGEILNITLETLVSLNVSGGDVNDDQVRLIIRDNVNVAMPASDVLGIYQRWLL